MMKIKKESNEVEYNQNKLFIVNKKWINRIKKAINNLVKSLEHAFILIKRSGTRDAYRAYK